MPNGQEPAKMTIHIKEQYLPERTIHINEHELPQQKAPLPSRLG